MSLVSVPRCKRCHCLNDTQGLDLEDDPFDMLLLHHTKNCHQHIGAREN